MKSIIKSLLLTLFSSRPSFNDGTKSLVTENTEQAVIAHLKLTGNEFGTTQERDSIRLLEKNLNEAIIQNNAGEYDGHEFGEGFAILYMYGSDANKLFDVVFPSLKEYLDQNGSYIRKRYGKPGEKEEKIIL